MIDSSLCANSPFVTPDFAPAVATAASIAISTDSGDQRTLPRAIRKPRRPPEDKGLPADEDLAKLATEYLKRQRKHWPQLTKAGLLPEPTLGIIAQMVDDFKHRHRTGEVAPDAVEQFGPLVKKLGGSYSRYSCDNSKTTSIIDQLNKNLDKAGEEERFVPWSYVFADFSVSGLTASRVGYSSYKTVLKDPSHKIETTYIDDFTRASRDEIEWWKLADFVRRLRKRLIGSSDGFDLNSPQGEMLIGIYALLSRLHIKSLREKVNRGMQGAAERGTVLGKLPYGFVRRSRQDELGRPVLNPDGTPITEPCIDPETAPIVVEIVEMFLQQKLSTYRIAQSLNERKVDNWDRWDRSMIANILSSPALIGVFIWNRGRREYDLTAERYVQVKNPRSDWKVYYNKNLAIIPIDLFRQLRRRLAGLKRRKPTGVKPLSRNQVSASTLFSGTLFCGYCDDRELTLFRSVKKGKSLFCPNGRKHAGGCQLSTSKSTKIIETALLGFLTEKLLTEENVKALVTQANAYLAELAAEPPTDVKPLKAEIRRIEEKISRLVRKVEDEKDERVSRDYHKRITELRGQAIEKSKQLRELSPTNGKAIKLLNEATVLGYLQDMRGLLNQDIPVAAEALRALTGPIRITQRVNPNRKRGATWVASFQPRLIGLLQRVAKDKNTSGSLSLGPLRGRIASVSKTVEVQIRQEYKYEQHAPIFKQLHDSGMSVSEISRKYGFHDYDQVRAILEFADTGKQPDWRQKNAEK